MTAISTGTTGRLQALKSAVTSGRGRSSDLSFLPVLAALAIIWLVFGSMNENFISPANLTNLTLQIAATGTIAVGVVLILLIGEIDLSVGALSGFAAGVMAVLNVRVGVPGPIAIVAAVALGIGIGVFNGLWITRTAVPAFVVTLAGLLAWQGALLAVLGGTGTVNITDRGITQLAQGFLPAWLSWIAMVVVLAVLTGASLRQRRRRVAKGLGVPSATRAVLRIIVAASVGSVGVAVLNADRGVPYALVLLLGLIVVFDLVIRRTRLGRHIMSVGGNAEAARRAGINVDGIRVFVFAAAGGAAALGGVVAASRLFAVNQSSGAGDLLLNAIAAAVIGGTSLFGGRGSMWAAFLGALVIGSISNGMDLLGYVTSVKFLVTGAVLLLSVTVDARARERRRKAGGPS